MRRFRFISTPYSFKPTRERFTARGRTVRRLPRTGDLRNEGRGARRQGRAERKLPVTSQLGWCGCRKLAAYCGGSLNLHSRGGGIEQRHTDWRDEKLLALLWEIMRRRQSAARLVAVARAGIGARMPLRAAIPFAKQAGCIKQAARNRRQPNERQHQRDHCLDTLHEESNTTAAWPGAIWEIRQRLQPRAGSSPGPRL